MCIRLFEQLDYFPVPPGEINLNDLPDDIVSHGCVTVNDLVAKADDIADQRDLVRYEGKLRSNCERASPTIPNFRSTAARNISLLRYTSRSLPSVKARMLAAAFAISQRYALASRCIEDSLLLSDALENVRIANRAVLDQVHGARQQGSKRFP